MIKILTLKWVNSNQFSRLIFAIRMLDLYQEIEYITQGIMCTTLYNTVPWGVWKIFLVLFSNMYFEVWKDKFYYPFALKVTSFVGNGNFKIFIQLLRMHYSQIH